MATKYQGVDGMEIFSVVEEDEFYRLVIGAEEVKEGHVEDFLDTTVEWLSRNPEKGILIDFDGVSGVCPEFSMHLLRIYEDIKSRGLYVRFINMDPSIKDDVKASTITMVFTSPLPDKPVVSAREILADLAEGLSDQELMVKHRLSFKGLESMFRKMVEAGLMTKSELGQRWGMSTDEIAVGVDTPPQEKVKVDATSALKDIAAGLTDKDMMEKYKLSKKGLKSLFQKLKRRGLISQEALKRRSKEKGNIDTAEIDE